MYGTIAQRTRYEAKPSWAALSYHLHVKMIKMFGYCQDFINEKLVYVLQHF